MSETPTHIQLTTDPARHPEVFASAFNTGDVDILEQVYEPGALFVPQPGTAVTGKARRLANAEFLELGLPITVSPRHVYALDDVALLIVDFVIAGTARHGGSVRIEGTATDVARRGADGYWRYAIDNPFGVAEGPAGSGRASTA
ncbi:YybH family protein [Actinoalloteichus caeruleus]|uniref:Ketosteroid isomerase homolog n=1 Tax=Actinoalloteichus caeruleus DSM 43889 TaxID=1120930 RepID=A0ABT1JN86_ACTCY|nr:DUF4440 domain-containing protein [Actinoalloteichus caeruleus]MCP2333993.1 Ketosteroid isomerase homolog [Actinoalloteichus caeruleus DSM 43889]